MEIIHEAPKDESFTPLAVYQSQTPESFFSGPPVLYHHSPSATLSIHKSDLECAPILSRLAEGARKASNGTSSAVNGSSHNEEEEDEELSIPNIDIWVTSERLTLYSLSLITGLSIPYPSITLHAIQPPSPPTNPSPSLFLQLLTEAQTFDDHDPDSTISLTLIPAAPPPPPPPPASSTTTEEDGDDEAAPRETETEPPTQALYTALSACANLHPDPLSSDDGADEIDGDEHQQRQQPGIMFESVDGDGDASGVYPIDSGRGLPPPMPGSGGWITAENVGEFFDEEGNWRGRGGGVGTVRRREEEEGEDGDGEETKWRRTE